jgi:mannosyltransferase
MKANKPSIRPPEQRIPPLLFGALVIGAVIRFYQANESLWLDELHSSWSVSGSLSKVAERAAIGNQSPLYFWIAWFFARLPIQPEIALRLPSLLAGGALPCAVYWLTRKLTPDAASNDGPALLAAWLTALDPLAIFYSQEARPYALLMLTTVLHVGALLEVLRSAAWRWRAAWIASGALLVYWNYTGGLLLIADLVAFGACAILSTQPTSTAAGGERKPRRLALLPFPWIDFALLVLLLLPALPALLDVGARRQNWSAFVTPQPVQAILTLYPWSIAGLFLIVAQRFKPLLEVRALVVLICWLFVPMVIAWLTTTLGVAPLFFSRYLIGCLLASLIAQALMFNLLCS